MELEETRLLPKKLLADLAKRGDLHTFAKGEILITEGAASDALFVLISGQLKVFTRETNGLEIIFNMLQPGEMFGEMFLDGGTRSASVKATADSKCVVIDDKQIKQLIRTVPDFSESLIQSLIARLRRATLMIKSLVMNDVYERTTALLNQVALTEGKTRVVPTDMTQQEIANRVGATREMINHVISGLIKGGFMSRDEKRRLVFTKSLPTRW